MKRFLLVLVTAALPACAASNELLPKVGDALISVKDAVTATEQARAALEGVYDQFCGVDMLPTLAPVCPKIRVALDGVASGVLAGEGALNVAIGVYTDVNDAVKAAQ